ncbi:protein kinase [Candidatus Margulisiibacteriota bacterium]
MILLKVIAVRKADKLDDKSLEDLLKESKEKDLNFSFLNNLYIGKVSESDCFPKNIIEEDNYNSPDSIDEKRTDEQFEQPSKAPKQIKYDFVAQEYTQASQLLGMQNNSSGNNDTKPHNLKVQSPRSSSNDFSIDQYLKKNKMKFIIKKQNNTYGNYQAHRRKNRDIVRTFLIVNGQKHQILQFREPKNIGKRKNIVLIVQNSDGKVIMSEYPLLFLDQTTRLKDKNKIRTDSMAPYSEDQSGNIMFATLKRNKNNTPETGRGGVMLKSDKGFLLKKCNVKLFDNNVSNAYDVDPTEDFCLSKHWHIFEGFMKETEWNFVLSKSPYFVNVIERGIVDNQNGTFKMICRMEDMSGGNLEYFPNKLRYQKQSLRSVFEQPLEGLSLLARKGIFHGDIKPKNILFNIETVIQTRKKHPSKKMKKKKIEVKICDFGCTQKVENIDPKEIKALTIRYIAPELVRALKEKQVPVNHLMDLWALGVSQLEFLLDQPSDQFFFQKTERKLNWAVHNNFRLIRKTYLNAILDLCNKKIINRKYYNIIEKELRLENENLALNNIKRILEGFHLYQGNYDELIQEIEVMLIIDYDHTENFSYKKKLVETRLEKIFEKLKPFFKKNTKVFNTFKNELYNDKNIDNILNHRPQPSAILRNYF